MGIFLCYLCTYISLQVQLRKKHLFHMTRPLKFHPSSATAYPVQCCRGSGAYGKDPVWGTNPSHGALAPMGNSVTQHVLSLGRGVTMGVPRGNPTMTWGEHVNCTHMEPRQRLEPTSHRWEATILISVPPSYLTFKIAWPKILIYNLNVAPRI